MKLVGAGNLPEVDIDVVPAELEEVLAAVTQDPIANRVAVAVLVRVLGVDHPVAANLGCMHSPVGFLGRAGVPDASAGVIEAWSSDIEVMGTIAAHWVGWGAVVGSLEDDGGQLTPVSINVTGALHLPALSTTG